MKSSFGLTDECVWDWRRWVSFVERFGTGGTVGTHPGTADPEDACYENRETQTKQSADSLIAYCRDHVLAGRVVDPPRDRVVANLWRAYETLPLGGNKNNPPPLESNRSGLLRAMLVTPLSLIPMLVTPHGSIPTMPIPQRLSICPPVTTPIGPARSPCKTRRRRTERAFARWR